RRRHTRFSRDWSSDVCSSDLSKSACVTGAYATLSCQAVYRNISLFGILADGSTLLPGQKGAHSDCDHDAIGRHVQHGVEGGNRQIGRASVEGRKVDIGGSGLI